MKSARGFTLVEIVVGVGIISILVGALVLYIQPVAQINRAKDAQRKSDIDQVKKALDLYYNDKGGYPTEANFSTIFGGEFKDCPASNPNCTTSTVYMKKVPQDPTCGQPGGSCYTYKAQPGNNAPQWYVLYAQLAASQSAGESCPITSTSPNCVPSTGIAYDPSKFACTFSGSVDCQVSTQGGSSGSGMRCRSFYCNADGDTHFSSTASQACAEGVVPPIPAGCQATAGDDCNDSDPNAWQRSYCYMDSDGDGYTVNTATSYCGTTAPLNCLAAPSALTDCNDNDPSVALNRQLYPDGDGDLRYSSSVTSICSAPTGPGPTGYSTTPGTDCDDTNGLKYQLLSCRNGTQACFTQTCTGATCPSGSSTSCDSGQSTCTTGTQSCCVAFATDTNNCGRCGHACAGLQECNAGICTQFPLSGLIAYFSMDELASNLPASSVGNITVSTGSSPTRSTDAKLGAARDFNGTNNYLQFTGLGSMNDFSVSYWTKIRLPSNSWGYGHFIESSTSPGGGWQNLINDGDRKWWANWNNYASGAVSTNVWHHMVVTHTTGTETIYLDGSPIAPCLRGMCDFAANSPWFIGRYSAQAIEYLNGLMDEVGIWNRVLTGTEVTKLYSGGAGVTLPTDSACYNNNLQSDTNNCGVCGNVCPAGLSCSGAKCGKRVFVTSQLVNGNLGGLSGADAKCQQLANSAVLGGTWKAWLSDSTTDASSRLTHATVPYINMGGKTVAGDWNDLTDGGIQNAINYTEQGNLLGTANNDFYTLTYTDFNGIKASGTYNYSGHPGSAGYNCNNWTSNTNTGTGINNSWLGTVGLAGAGWLDKSWTNNIYGNCFGTQTRLYCVEQ